MCVSVAVYIARIRDTRIREISSSTGIACVHLCSRSRTGWWRWRLGCCGCLILKCATPNKCMQEHTRMRGGEAHGAIERPFPFPRKHTRNACRLLHYLYKCCDIALSCISFSETYMLRSTVTPIIFLGGAAFFHLIRVQAPCLLFRLFTLSQVHPCIDDPFHIIE